jgi:DNA-binding SARP family transcriptional activator
MLPTLPLLHIRLLGDFSLASGEEPVAGVNTPRPQALLAYLALHREAPQARQQLAFRFWPDTTEAQARNNLRQTLHVLRHALPGADALLIADTNTLQWRPGGPYTLDVAEFERALAAGASGDQSDGQASARRTALERAIDLYRGDLLPTCYDDWITSERDRLRQRFQQALEEMARLLERQRDYAAAAGYARRLVRLDPLNEDAYRELMRLLALKGDRAGALRVYHTCATILRRELGVDPSPATNAAYERVIQQDAPAPLPAEQAPTLGASPSLVGRQAAWEQLRLAWERAGAGAPGFVLILGEAGIGKSRLADEFVRWAGQRGATAVRARCYAAEGRLSLAPVTEWLRADGVRPSLDHLHAVWLAEVARLLPELASDHPDLPRYEPITEYGQRQRFFEALARGVHAAPQPLVAFIDDLQWCDQETLEWLHLLLRFDSSARLLVIGTARAEELPPAHPLHTLLVHLRNTVEVTEIALQPLDAAETAHLARLVTDRALDVAAAMRLFRDTEGVPLFVIETLRGAAGVVEPGVEVGEGQAAPGEAAPLPPRVRAVIAARLAQLAPPARELAALAATIGREFPFDVLAHASTLDEESVVRALDELWHRRIVREQGTNTYDFTHDKLREVAYAEISAPQRRLLHRRIAHALETICARDLDPVSGQIAAHYERAGMAEQAVPYFQRAAAVAQHVYANEDAIKLLSSALALLAELPGGTQRDARELSLLLALAPVLRITRGWTAPELERVVYRSLALCDTIGDDTRRSEALFGLQSMLTVQAKLEQVQVVAGQLRALDERFGRGEQPLSDVMEAGSHLHLGHVSTANDAFERVLAAHDPKRSPDFEEILGWNYAVLGRAWQAHALWCLGYPERAMRRGHDAIQLAQELRLPFNQALASAYVALLRQLCADPAEARAEAEAALVLASEYKAPYYRAWASILVTYAAACERPDGHHLTDLRAAIDALLASGARLRVPYYLWLLAGAQGQAGQTAEGLATLDEALAESRANNERWWDAELHRTRGEMLLASGHDAGDAESALWRAREIARAQQARSLELRAALSLARLWRAQHRVADARTLVGEVYGWFTEGFDTPDLRAAHALLAELA